MKLWTLWQAVKAPPRTRHPLYQRGVRLPFQLNNALSCALIFGALLFIMPLILLISSVIGTLAAATSSAAISRERETGRFALLAVTPEGAFGASWLLGLGAVHRRDAYRRVQSWQTWVFRGAIIFIGVFVLELMLNANRAVTISQTAVIMLEILLILAGFYIDHMQALTLGVLVGVWMPTVAPDRIGAQTGAVMIYLLLRVLTLLVALVLVFGILPLLPLPALITRLVQFGAFVAVNELFVLLIWLDLVDRLNGDARSLQRWRLPVG